MAISLLEVVISYSSTPLRAFKVLPQIARLLRVFRIARILRLVGKYEGLQALITTVIFSLPALLSVLALLFILLFVFAILGVFLFRNVVSGNIINVDQGGYIGFTNFGLAMIVLFKMTTNEDWNNVYADTVNPANCAHGTDCVS